MSPHRAVARNYQQLGDIGLDRIKPYWFTPVLHAIESGGAVPEPYPFGSTGPAAAARLAASHGAAWL